MKMFFFGIYSWVTNILFCIGEFMPPVIRKAVFKLLFAQYGRNTYIDYGCYMRYMARIKVGNNVSVNKGCRFYGSFFEKNTYITIGNNVAIGPEVSIFAAGHDYNYIDLPDIAASVEIGNNVWIGGRSIILPGVKIGEGCIIGAGSIVTKDIEPWSVAVGAPAKIIKKRVIVSGE